MYLEGHFEFSKITALISLNMLPVIFVFGFRLEILRSRIFPVDFLSIGNNSFLWRAEIKTSFFCSPEINQKFENFSDYCSRFCDMKNLLRILDL